VEPHRENVVYWDREYVPKRVSLGTATTDAQGRVTATFKVPDDYGGVHDVYAVVDGQDVARGGLRVMPQFSVTPVSGPVGTPITITGKGIGVKVWESLWAVTYDNKYTGWLSAVTTRGTARAVLRAAGPPGKHVITIWHGGQGVPYLNWEQSPQAHIPIFTFEFTVTEDAGPPPASVDWPDADAVVTANDGVVRTTSGDTPALLGVSAAINPVWGPVGSRATLTATGLEPNSPVDLVYMTARGSRTSGLGWGLAETGLGQAKTDGQGTLKYDFEIPDDLGGWHTVKLVQNGRVVAEAPVLVVPSLVGVTPTRVRVGETFQVHIKGVGWTELDNIYAVTYDNAFIGFACGFNSNGDVTINLQASGQPGTHLIDLYPAIYQAVGHAQPPLLYDIPQLTFYRDHLSLALGYRLPAFRLAIEVVGD
jgi:hypothetical protein